MKIIDRGASVMGVILSILLVFWLAGLTIGIGLIYLDQSGKSGGPSGLPTVTKQIVPTPVMLPSKDIARIDNLDRRMAGIENKLNGIGNMGATDDPQSAQGSGDAEGTATTAADTGIPSAGQQDLNNRVANLEGSVTAIQDQLKEMSDNLASNMSTGRADTKKASARPARQKEPVPAKPKKPVTPQKAEPADSKTTVASVPAVVKKKPARKKASAKPSAYSYTPPKSKTPQHPMYHRVEQGDTLSNISRQYGMKFTDLIHYNRLNPSTPIYPGQILLVDAGTGSLSLLPPDKDNQSVLTRGIPNLYPDVSVLRQHETPGFSGSSLYNLSNRFAPSYGVSDHKKAGLRKLAPGFAIYPW